MYGLLSPASAAGLAAASGLNPPVEQHAISTPTRGQRRRGGDEQEGRRSLGSNIVTDPCDVCEGMGEEGDTCSCGLHLSAEDFVCYHCEQPYDRCTC